MKKPPPGYNHVSPYLLVADVDACIAFLRDVFAAEIVTRHTREDGSPGHGEVRIGDSLVMMGQSDAVPMHLHVYVDDVDETFARALACGAVCEREPETKSHGDRMAGVRDLFGNTWWIATRLE